MDAPPPESAYFTVEQAQATLRAATRDLLMTPRRPDGTPRIMLQTSPTGLGKSSLMTEALIETGKHALILSPTHALAEQSQEWINRNPDASAGLHFSWNPDAGPLPPGYVDDSEDMIAGVTLDTEWDGDIEDAPHDRIYAEVERRAAEAKAAASTRTK